MKELSAQPLVLGRTGILPFQTYKIEQHNRDDHMYIIGVTGKGKSKFLESLIFQDITQGRGVCVIDPNGLLAYDVIRYLASYKNNSYMKSYHFDIPQNLNNIIYIDPSIDDYIIPINPLARIEGVEDYRLAQQIKQVLIRLWPEALKSAPQFASIFSHAILLLIENELTLMELQKVLTNKDYREHLLQSDKTKTRDIAEYFHERFDKWIKDEPAKIESTLNKIDMFTLNPQLKRILGQKKSINFHDIMDEGKVLVVNLGNCEPETRNLLGSLITVKLQQAAFSRLNIRQKRTLRPYFLFLDEFQCFLNSAGDTETFSEILSQARKYKLHLILSHQTQGQMNEEMQSSLGNAGTTVVFGIDRLDAEKIAKKIFTPDTNLVKEQPKTSTQHTLYDPLNNQWEKSTQSLDKRFLKKREAYVVSHQRKPVKIKTIEVLDRQCTQEQLEQILLYSVGKWGNACGAVEEELNKRSACNTVKEYARFFVKKSAKAVL